MILTVTLNPTVDKNYFVDALIPGEVIRVRDCSMTAGGKGINVSKVAALLGAKTVAAGFIGGHTGSFISAFLDKAGVETSFIQINEETRTCTNINDNSSGKQTELLEAGSEVCAEKQAEFISHFKNIVNRCEIAVISGSVPKGINENMYPELISIAKSAGKKVILDTSGKLLKAGIEALPHIVKPNKNEMIDLIGRDIKTKDEIIAAACELKAKGIETVIVSLGKDGAVFVTNDGIYQGTTPDIPIVNTVACGDSLVAGFAVSLSRGVPVTEAIKLAMAVSTANALRKETGFFIKEDLERLLTMVEAIKL